MSYFVVTKGLRERLLASVGARTINTASAAHQGATLDFDDLQSAKNFRAVTTYGRSKLCNILFTRQLARRLHGTGVIANCLHPGFVATRFADESGGLVSHLAWLAKFFAISPAEGAQTIIYLASSPEVANVTGKYFYKCRPTTPSAPALDDRRIDKDDPYRLLQAARRVRMDRNTRSLQAYLGHRNIQNTTRYTAL